eukprot:m.263384 g.263384  ORF g.263384 m.263384 type:complete len:431 (-) comp50252_c0_seq1:509-1801(-)
MHALALFVVISLLCGTVSGFPTKDLLRYGGEFGVPAVLGGFAQTKHWVHHGSNYFCASESYWSEHIKLGIKRDANWRQEETFSVGETVVTEELPDDTEVFCTPAVITLGSPRTGSHTLRSVLESHPLMFISKYENTFWAKASIAGTDESDINWKQYIFGVLRNRGNVPITKKMAIAGAIRAEHATNYLAHVNRELSGNADSIPALMKTFFPRIKLLSAYRCAVERSWSHFFVFYDQTKYGGETPAERFHNTVLYEIAAMNKCFENSGPVNGLKWALCAFGSAEGMANDGKYGAHVGTEDFPSNGFTMIRKSIYSLYWEVWLRHFPPSQFYVYHTELVTSPKYSSELIEFVGLPTANKTLDPCENAGTNQKHDCGGGVINKNPKSAPSINTMLPETRALLEKFYEPFEKRGCQLLPYTCDWYSQCAAKAYV